MTGRTPPEAEQRTSKQLRALVVIAGLLAVGALMNFVWNLTLPETVIGFRPHPDNSLSTLVDIEQPLIRTRHSFDANLHDLARSGTLRVPSEQVIYPLQVENLAQMSIEVADYEVVTSQPAIAALGGEVIVEGRGVVARAGLPVSFRFVMLDESLAPSVTYYTIGQIVVVVDDRLGTP